MLLLLLSRRPVTWALFSVLAFPLWVVPILGVYNLANLPLFLLALWLVRHGHPETLTAGLPTVVAGSAQLLRRGHGQS